MHARDARFTRFARIVVLAALLGAHAGCGDSAPSKVCTPGSTQGCSCPGNRTGTQVCNSSGSGYEQCVCEADGRVPDGPLSDITVDTTADTTPADAPPDTSVDGGPGADVTHDTAADTTGDSVSGADTTRDGVLETAPPTDSGTDTSGDSAPVCSPTIIGTTCTPSGGQCGAAGTCVLTSATLGVCGCPCTPDDPNTPLVNEDSCPNPSANVCGSIALSGGGTLNVCLKLCKPKLGSNDCTAPLACSPRSASSSGSIDKAVCLQAGCTQDSDCPVTTATACNTAAPTCPTGQQCLPLISGGTAGVCAGPGKCDTASGLCDKHTGTLTAKVGDTCTADTDCGEYMTCQIEIDRVTTLGQKDHNATCSSDGECCGSCNLTTGRCEGTCKIESRNGYCTIAGCTFASATTYSQFACPTGSTCNNIFFGGLCMKDCDLAMATDCRNNANDKYGDYECYAWNNLSVGGVPVAANPVCSFSIAPCDIFGSNFVLDCTSLGNQSNPTSMGCRSLATKQLLSNTRDPAGYCLDNTTSGP